MGGVFLFFVLVFCCLFGRRGSRVWVHFGSPDGVVYDSVVVDGSGGEGVGVNG